MKSSAARSNHSAAYHHQFSPPPRPSDVRQLRTSPEHHQLPPNHHDTHVHAPTASSSSSSSPPAVPSYGHTSGGGDAPYNPRKRRAASPSPGATTTSPAVAPSTAAAASAVAARKPLASFSSAAAAAAASSSTTSRASTRGVASLTPEQLAKKRANDREAQRAIRERTRNQIETLERRVRELTSQQPYQELQQALRQKEAAEAENAEIKRRLASVLSIIRPLLAPTSPIAAAAVAAAAAAGAAGGTTAATDIASAAGDRNGGGTASTSTSPTLGSYGGETSATPPSTYDDNQRHASSSMGSQAPIVGNYIMSSGGSGAPGIAYAQQRSVGDALSHHQSWNSSTASNTPPRPLQPQAVSSLVSCEDNGAAMDNRHQQGFSRPTRPTELTPSLLRTTSAERQALGLLPLARPEIQSSPSQDVMLPRQHQHQPEGMVDNRANQPSSPSPSHYHTQQHPRQQQQQQQHHHHHHHLHHPQHQYQHHRPHVLPAISNAISTPSPTTIPSPFSGRISLPPTPSINDFNTVPRHTAASCLLDQLLLGFVAEHQALRAEGVSEAELQGPAYPSFSAMLAPPQPKDQSAMGQHWTGQQQQQQQQQQSRHESRGSIDSTASSSNQSYRTPNTSNDGGGGGGRYSDDTCHPLAFLPGHDRPPFPHYNGNTPTASSSASPPARFAFPPTTWRKQHPLSQLLVDVITTFPDIAAPPEKCAVLLVMFLVMRWQCFPTRENFERLPVWMRPTERQMAHAHPVWIDYLPWPAMRDEMIIPSSPNARYPLENFFVPYTTTLSLSWERSDAELFTNATTSMTGNGNGNGRASAPRESRGSLGAERASSSSTPASSSTATYASLQSTSREDIDETAAAAPTAHPLSMPAYSPAGAVSASFSPLSFPPTRRALVNGDVAHSRVNGDGELRRSSVESAGSYHKSGAGHGHGHGNGNGNGNGDRENNNDGAEDGDAGKRVNGAAESESNNGGGESHSSSSVSTATGRGERLVPTPSTGEELLINPEFEAHLKVLDNWTLGPAFVKAFPSLVPSVRIVDKGAAGGRRR